MTMWPIDQPRSALPELVLSAGAFMSIISTSNPPWKGQASQGATQLVRAAHPQRLSDALDRRLAAITIERLRTCARLHDRIAPLLTQRRLGEETDTQSDDTTMPADKQALFDRLVRVDLEEVSRLAGAAWHALSLRQMIRGRDVADLVARIGRPAHAFGLRREGVAPAMHAVAPDALAERIIRDGYACLGVWFLSFPMSMRRLLQIRLPPGTPAEAPELGDVQRALGLIEPVLSEFDEAANASA